MCAITVVHELCFGMQRQTHITLCNYYHDPYIRHFKVYIHVGTHHDFGGQYSLYCGKYLQLRSLADFIY